MVDPAMFCGQLNVIDELPFVRDTVPVSSVPKPPPAGGAAGGWSASMSAIGR